MEKTFQFLLWMLVVLVILSSFSTGWFFVGKEKIYGEYIKLQDLYEMNTSRLKAEILSSKKENTELKTKLEMVEKALDTSKSKNKEIGSQNENLIKDKEDFIKKIALLEDDKSLLEDRVKDMESDLFIAGLLKEKVSLEVELKRMRNSLEPKDMEIEKLNQENMSLNMVIAGLKKEKGIWEHRLKDSSDVAEILSRDLLKEKDRNVKENADIKVENRLLKNKLSELEGIKDRFGKLMSEKDRIQFKSADLEKDLQYKSQELEKLKVAFQKKIRDLEELRAEAYHSPKEVELPPIVLQKGHYGDGRNITLDIGKDKGSLLNKGRIVTLNEEYEFVVIDLGKDDGIEVGTDFDVYRDGILVGSVEVIQVRDKISACDIKSVQKGSLVKVNDVIVKR